MKLNEKDIAALKEIVESPPMEITIATHTNPDGDALGSALAWGSLLEAHGHRVTYAIPNRYPYFLGWMRGIDKFVVFKDDAEGRATTKIAEADVVFCMDFNQIDRLEGLGSTILANTKAVRILIDHHLDPPEGYRLVFSNPESSSTSYLVYKIVERMYGTDAITLEMGESLFVGMMTDTGNFAFSHLTPDLFRAVAVLVDKGVDIPRIHCLVYNSFTADRVKLLGYALSRMETVKAGETEVAYIPLRESDLRKFNFQQGDSEGFVNYPLTIRGLGMSAIFIENRHFIRTSFRSRGDVDVNRFANLYFEGGGHKNASGGKSFRSMQETVVHFEKCVREFFGPGGAGYGTGKGEC